MQSSFTFSEFLGYLGGCVGLLVSGYFAFCAYRFKIALNPATWGTVFVLDVVGVVLVLLTRSPSDSFPILQCAWSFAACATTLVALRNGSRFVWGVTEYVSVIGAGVTAVVYVVSRLGYITASGFVSPNLWLESYCLSCLISVIPQAINYTEDSQSAKESLWMWRGTGYSLLISLCGVLFGMHEINLESMQYATLLQIYVFLFGLNLAMTSLIRVSIRMGQSM